MREDENKNVVFDEATYVAYWVDKNFIDSYEYEIAQILKSNEDVITLEKLKEADEIRIDISGAFEIPNEQLICILPRCLKLDTDMDEIHEHVYNEIFSTSGQNSRPQMIVEEDDDDDDDDDDVVDNAMGDNDFISFVI